MKNHTHVVLDLETVSTEKEALILSIGYAIVKDGEIVNMGEIRPRMEQQPNRHVSFDTIRWWLDGTKADAQRHLSSIEEYDVDVALEVFRAAVECHGDWSKVRVWGNSPNFDCDILAGLYRAMGKEVPWKFYNERDMRTLRDMHKHDRTVPKIAHSAMWDAVAEAEDLCNYLRSL